MKKTLGKKLTNIAERHKLPVFKAVLYELFIRLYTSKYFRGFVKYVIRVKQPRRIDFVVGCYNSGTTIIKDAIAAHPDICSAPIEGDQLTGAISDNESGFAPRAMMINVCNIAKDRESEPVDADLLVSDLRPWLKEDTVFLEKSISNTVRINRLRSSLPGSKFVCVTRAVDDVVNGIKKRSQPAGMLLDILGQNDYPDRILRRQWWMFYQLVLNDYDESDVYFVSYERFLKEPDEQLLKIYKFLELDEVDVIYQDNILKVNNTSLLIKNQKQNERVEYLSSYSELKNAVNDIRAMS